ncbi:hypothetical protein WMY93_029906 [Mugilogobius chulae]|uniref:All trans-polyprenyl-diphosphate synthase PDSS1 n=1 Tax=Mugilogobius chulae TaxID=88201 RepID=A0AAW0MQS7_9GOBI
MHAAADHGGAVEECVQDMEYRLCYARASWSCAPGSEVQPYLLQQPTPITLQKFTAFLQHKPKFLCPTLQSCRQIHSDELFVGTELKSLCDYYFDGKGKAIRPMIVVLMARAMNIHNNRDGDLLPGQKAVAMVSEMIHTASLVHDDVIDGSDQRRGKRTINEVWGERKAILAGDFILSVIEDLVRGEFMQLGSKENENERFKHYLEKTFKKTASLIANSCKAVSILVSPDPEVHEIAYQYGRNVGIAFQLVDDVLDFTSGSSQLGKPTAADLKLGLATGPVLFACQQFPELHAMIMRRFSSKGDVDRAWQYVLQSDGVQQTRFLAQRYCQEAIRQLSLLRPSPERDALIRLTEMVLSREK